MGLLRLITTAPQDTQPVIFGSLFQEARDKKGYSLDFVAHHAELDGTPSLLAFEQGRVSLPLDRIYAIANILEISPQIILNLLP